LRAHVAGKGYRKAKFRQDFSDNIVIGLRTLLELAGALHIHYETLQP
jgi:hypothetical protein